MTKTYHIVFDVFPAPAGPKFIELENEAGQSIGTGEWRQRPDGYTEMVLPAPDPVYAERNQLVAALSKIFPSGQKKTAIEGWDEAWHNCIYIELPTGQVSWHIHDREMEQFSHLPRYYGEWDGHDTPEKYRRVAALRSFQNFLLAPQLSDAELAKLASADLGPILAPRPKGHSAADIVKRIAEVATATGAMAGEPAIELAGQIISVLAVHPEHIDRFMAEGSELFIDGTFNPEHGSMTYRANSGAILHPSVLREKNGSQQ